MDTPVRRREVLAGIGIGLCAGCLGDGSGAESPSTTGSDGTGAPVQHTADAGTPSPTATPTRTPGEPGGASVTLDEDGTVAASATAVPGSDDTANTPDTPTDTPGPVPRNSTSDPDASG